MLQRRIDQLRRRADVRASTRKREIHEKKLRQRTATNSRAPSIGNGLLMCTCACSLVKGGTRLMSPLCAKDIPANLDRGSCSVRHEYFRLLPTDTFKSFGTTSRSVATR